MREEYDFSGAKKNPYVPRITENLLSPGSDSFITSYNQVLQHPVAESINDDVRISSIPEVCRTELI